MEKSQNPSHKDDDKKVQPPEPPPAPASVVLRESVRAELLVVEEAASSYESSPGRTALIAQLRAGYTVSGGAYAYLRDVLPTHIARLKAEADALEYSSMQQRKLQLATAMKKLL